MPDHIYLDPDSPDAGAAVIKVGGQCYQNAGPRTDVTYDTSSVDSSYGSCPECNPADCSCPPTGQPFTMECTFDVPESDSMYHTYTNTLTGVMGDGDIASGGTLMFIGVSGDTIALSAIIGVTCGGEGPTYLNSGAFMFSTAGLPNSIAPDKYLGYTSGPTTTTERVEGKLFLTFVASGYDSVDTHPASIALTIG